MNPMRLRKKVSIVIPAYNEEKNLPHILKSLNEQGFYFEIIVADAQSTDATAMIAKAHGCKVVPAKRGNPAMARNAGAHAASGEIIIFFDADVIVPKDFLRKNVLEFERRILDVAGVYAKADSNNLFDKFYIDVLTNSWYFLFQRIWPNAMGCCMFIRKDAHQKIKGFDESITFAEDCDYVNRAFRAGFKFGVLGSSILPISMRRFEKKGRIAMGVYYVYLTFRRMLFGEIRKKINYDYGGLD